jgi:hypothetical protein
MFSAISLTTDRLDATAAVSVPSQIELFLSGATDGAALFGALYDEVLDEPVPDRLKALCRTI